MSTVNVEMLAKKIQKEYRLDNKNARMKAEEVIRSSPEVLFPNICEWANDEPLSDIYLGRYSLPMILAIWNSRDFLRALAVMKELYDGETDTAELKIWAMRR